MRSSFAQNGISSRCDGSLFAKLQGRVLVSLMIRVVSRAIVPGARSREILILERKNAS